jgi:hypothetical protein
MRLKLIALLIGCGLAAVVAAPAFATCGYDHTASSKSTSDQTAHRRANPMIRIPVSQAAFEAVGTMSPLGRVVYEPLLNAKGERLIWIEPAVLDKLEALRGPRESLSDVILRLVKMESA